MADDHELTGAERQLRLRLNEILSTLIMLVQQDQRVGVKALYQDDKFRRVVRVYYDAAMEVLVGLDQDKLRVLKIAARDFTSFNQALFPSDHTRMLTVLRKRLGQSFSTLFKNTTILLQLVDFVELETDQDIGPINLPDQQSAPIYTKVENDRVTLETGHSLHPFLRAEAVTETRKYLRNELAEIDKALAASNIDRKYVETFSRLYDLANFQDDAGAISFGLHIRTVALLTKKIEEELSELLNVQIAATLTHAAFFASQYKDWMEFLHNAQVYQSRSVVETEMNPALEKIVSLLEGNPESIDERIPHTIRFISALLHGNAEDRKQAIFASVRSIENFCISTIKYSYEQAKALLQDAGTTARPKLVKIGAFAIITVALGVIGHFMPVIVNTAELNWIVENLPNIKKLSDILRP